MFLPGISEAAKVMQEGDSGGEEGGGDRQAAAADALTDCAVKGVEGGIAADNGECKDKRVHRTKDCPTSDARSFPGIQA